MRSEGFRRQPALAGADCLHIVPRLSSRHPCIPHITPVLYQELFQWNIKGLICRKSQKKSMKSNLGKFLRYCNFNFLQCKNWPIFANFEPFFPYISILLIFWIEWMFPKGSQILVHDFRHQKFWNLDLFLLSYGHFSETYWQNHQIAL